MKLAIFDAHRFDRESFARANESGGFGHELAFLRVPLGPATAALAGGFPAVCAFVHDDLAEPALAALAAGGTRLVALRCTGFDHADLEAAARLGLRVVRVPAYSPHAVAEHAMALLLALNRKLPRAHARVREGNFSLDGLVGFDLHGKTVGVVGTGRIGEAFVRIAEGFGCRVLASDPVENGPLKRETRVRYVPLDELLAHSDVVSVHAPLCPATSRLLHAGNLAKLKRGAILVNVSRGGLVDTQALLHGLKSGRIGGAALDVYDGEENLFFRDLSGQVLQDDLLARLLTLPNVLITAHQAFLTEEALREIAETTLRNVSAFEQGTPLAHELTRPGAAAVAGG